MARMLIAAIVLTAIGALASSCGGGLNPTLGAALIFEEEITDNIKAQIVLKDDDVLEDNQDGYWWY